MCTKQPDHGAAHAIASRAWSKGRLASTRILSSSKRPHTANSLIQQDAIECLTYPVRLYCHLTVSRRSGWRLTQSRKGGLPAACLRRGARRQLQAAAGSPNSRACSAAPVPLVASS